MKKKFIIAILVPLFVLSFVTELSFTQSCESEPIKIEQIDLDCAKVVKITGWDMDMARYFISETRAKRIDVFNEALPIICVETGGTYDFNMVYHDDNGTTDIGVFQINDSLYPFLKDQLKSEGRKFASWNRLNPQFNIAAGVYWLSYLKNYYGLRNEKLFTAYNQGVTGAQVFANRHGTYRSGYAQEVELAKEKIKEY